MSMMVVTFHCKGQEFAACAIEPVRSILEPFIDAPGFSVGQKVVFRPGGDCGTYDLEIGGWDDRLDVVGGVSVYRADHCLQLWEVLLRLSANARMVLMGDALGSAGCIAADREIVNEMPRDILDDFGPPVITTDANTALAAISGE